MSAGLCRTEKRQTGQNDRFVILQKKTVRGGMHNVICDRLVFIENIYSPLKIEFFSKPTDSPSGHMIAFNKSDV